MLSGLPMAFARDRAAISLLSISGSEKVTLGVPVGLLELKVPPTSVTTGEI